MTPAERERDLLDALLPITDPHERLSVIAAGWTGPGMDEADRTDDRLVPGCVSRVHLRTTTDGERLFVRWDADSPLVRGLAGLLCAVYHEVRLAEAVAHRSELITALGLDRQLSPTRLRGLGNVELRIHQLAAELLAGAGSHPAASP